ncbi:MAG TPA: DNA-binding protein, partial [Acidobacteriota bacterium]|nr:DNA-binding protein [Acidobacteriota bacterium]
ETIKGEVLSVEKFRPQEGMAYGIHLLIKSDKETISIHLGPEWFIAAQDTKIQPKDNIEVKGSRMTHRFFGGKPFIVAARVKKGDEVLVLRNDNGLPVWQAWRRALI